MAVKSHPSRAKSCEDKGIIPKSIKFTYGSSLAQHQRQVKAWGPWINWSHTHGKRRKNKWRHECQSSTGPLSLQRQTQSMKWRCPCFMVAFLTLMHRAKKNPHRNAHRPPIPDSSSFLPWEIPTVLTGMTNMLSILLIPPSRYPQAIFVYDLLTKM